jgi:kynurenine formamidase
MVNLETIGTDIILFINLYLAWTKQGIVGRGVLIDFVSYAEKNNLAYDPLGFHAIPLETFKTIAMEQNLEFLPGDIIFLRTGFTRAWEKAQLSHKQTIMAKSPFEYVGLESTVKVLEFLWDSQIAAVAGDCPGFEAWPPSGANAATIGVLEKGMHPTLLCGFGMPIGEMFDLEDLALQCEREKRWSFFVTSMPLNLRGGIASPPNATAVF